MNLEDELKQLEAATAREQSGNGPPPNFDAETAELREGWRVLTKALEANGSSFDEGALIAKLQRERAVPANAAGTNRRRNGWMVVGALGGALAASLLIVIAIGSGWFGQQQPVAKPGQTTIPQQNHLAANSATGGTSVDDGSDFAWDDPLDAQISVASGQIFTIRKSAHPLDTSISNLNYQLHQMARDLDEGAL